MRRSKGRLSLRMMFEAEGDIETDIPQKPGEHISVDRQILRQIMDAERTAVKLGKGQAAMTAMESIERASMRFLFEAEGDPAADPAAGEEAGTSEDGEKNPPIDVGVFATEIMRLVKNYDTLLDIPSVIVNRATEYLTVKYDEKTAESFKSVLRDDFDYEPAPDDTSEDSESEEPHQHLAVGARSGGATA